MEASQVKFERILEERATAQNIAASKESQLI